MPQRSGTGYESRPWPDPELDSVSPWPPPRRSIGPLSRLVTRKSLTAAVLLGAAVSIFVTALNVFLTAW